MEKKQRVCIRCGKRRYHYDPELRLCRECFFALVDEGKIRVASSAPVEPEPEPEAKPEPPSPTQSGGEQQTDDDECDLCGGRLVRIRGQLWECSTCGALYRVD